MRSMTGFGSAAAENLRHRMTVTLRSVNHRFLDIALRLRDEQRGSDGAVRDRLAAELHRGRVEVSVEVVTRASAGPVIDLAALTALVESLRELESRGLVTGGLTAGDVLRLPQLLRLDAGESWGEAEEALLLEALDAALAQLVASRQSEGGRLSPVLHEKLAGLAAVEVALRAAVGPAREATAKGLAERLERLLGERQMDQDRLAQEVALLADKSDVTEELDRLGAHLEHFRALLAEPGAIGKRLDFLTQEIFRELNTVGSKCRSAEMTPLVLDGKVLAEQLREQVQNVE